MVFSALPLIYGDDLPTWLTRFKAGPREVSEGDTANTASPQKENTPASWGTQGTMVYHGHHGVGRLKR